MSFTADIDMEPPKGVFRLWAAKPPLAGESCASWIQRLCGDHQYSFPVFGRVLGYLPSRGDWDHPLDAEVWQRLLGLVEFPGLVSNYKEMALLGAMSRSGKPNALMRMVDNKPAYRWCAACFAEDETPYLRWYWRLDGVNECWVHQAPLREECAVCAQPLWMHRARLTGGFASFLSECAGCGMSFSERGEYFRAHGSELQRKLRLLFSPWWVTGAVPSTDAIARLALNYHYVIKDRTRLANARFIANAHRRNKLLEQENIWTLDASSFRPDATLKSERGFTFRVPWQWRLVPMRRLKVAEALRSIRNELRTSQI